MCGQNFCALHGAGGASPLHLRAPPSAHKRFKFGITLFPAIIRAHKFIHDCENLTPQPVNNFSNFEMASGLLLLMLVVKEVSRQTRDPRVLFRRQCGNNATKRKREHENSIKSSIMYRSASIGAALPSSS